MKKSVGTFEAKTHFTKIISKVMAGEEVIISRRGKNVAKIVPIEKTSDKEVIQSTILRIRNLAKSMQLGKFNWNEWKSYKDEGRR
ncbi:prevent-host-death family protein [Candidatus Megaera polyxenophila]|jgi:prevent-host-death family protein|uniref:type II toxin-antitoxin system Phd/YefM family antitoxin n=1 Tax=Candidatus Megaera polyxenophila TaxID=988779 RepID=UPI00249F2768|nr:type II toxin-antitoxin system prevent-host-death family antitoxin [Candidatus Megaera polyxenophila]BBB57080.1 prevent-host-death family protein [Candidatus Megaera polyxenophila]